MARSGSRVLSRALSVALACGLAASVGVPAASAQVNGRTTYQGRLTEGGSPVNGNRAMTMRVMSAPVGGSEVMLAIFPAVPVAGGLFTIDMPPVFFDGSGAGVYTSLAQATSDYTDLQIEVVVNGVTLSPRQRIGTTPYASTALRAATLDSLTVVSGSTWQVSGSPGSVTVGGTNMRFQVGDSTGDGLVNYSQMFMLPAGAPEVDQDIFFANNGSVTGENIRFSEANDRFEMSDELFVSGRIAASTGAVVAGETFNRMGSGTPVSGAMNNAGDLFVSDDLEVLTSLLVGLDLRMRAGLAEGDSNIYFREGGSDFGEVFRWDDSEGRFFLSDDLRLGQTGVLELSSVSSGLTDGAGVISSNGGISIRIDNDDDESGINAGVFAITTEVAGTTTPLLILQSSNEANLQLDAGVQTNAFDFAEAFRAMPGHEDLEPGDVVALSTGEGLSEHCERSDQRSERLLLGVVSTKPAFTAGMSFDAIEEADPQLTLARNQARARGDEAEATRLESEMDRLMRQQWKPIAMVGRVPTKVDGRFGAIRKGDYLTSSPTPGHAMKLDGPGMALGVALEDFDAGEQGVISVFVRPFYHGDPAGTTQAQEDRLKTLETENQTLRDRLASIEAALATRLTQR